MFYHIHLSLKHLFTYSANMFDTMCEAVVLLLDIQMQTVVLKKNYCPVNDKQCPARGHSLKRCKSLCVVLFQNTKIIV